MQDRPAPLQGVHESESLIYAVLIAGIEYGIEAAHVEGTFEIERIAPVSGASADVLGLHAWNGAPVPVLDPRRRLGLRADAGETGSRRTAVVVRLGASRIAMAVDRVRGPLVDSTASLQTLDPVALLDDHAALHAPDPWADLRECLWKHASFVVSDVNMAWVIRRYRSAKWGRVLPSNQALASEFLEGFGSPCMDTLWNEGLQAGLRDLLPGASTRHFEIWNHGCGRGYDAVSVGCFLARERPRLHVKIWATDELRAIVEAQESSLSVFPGLEAVLEKIVFVCADAFLPEPESLPLIVCRDRLSFLETRARAAALAAFRSALRPGGTLITGLHERLPAGSWTEQPHRLLPSWKIQENTP